jgi:hypothetical protein
MERYYNLMLVQVIGRHLGTSPSLYIRYSVYTAPGEGIPGLSVRQVRSLVF